MKNWLLLLVTMHAAMAAPAQSTAETAAQRITSLYLQQVSASSAEQVSIKSAMRQLEESGLYKKTHALYIFRHFKGENLLNLVNPSAFDGAFRLSVESGDPQVCDSGLIITGDVRLQTHFVADQAATAPFLSLFWMADEGINFSVSSGASPFDISSRYTDGKNYISIWAASKGIIVPPAPAGFTLVQRSDFATVELFRADSVYKETLPITSANPLGGELEILGDRNKTYTLKIFGIAEAFTAAEVQKLREILEQMMEELK